MKPLPDKFEHDDDNDDDIEPLEPEEGKEPKEPKEAEEDGLLTSKETEKKKKSTKAKESKDRENFLNVMKLVENENQSYKDLLDGEELYQKAKQEKVQEDMYRQWINKQYFAELEKRNIDNSDPSLFM